MIYHKGQDLKNLIRELSSLDKVIRGNAAKEISSLAKRRIFDINSIEPLIKLLLDNNNRVSYNAAFAIGDLADYCGFYDRKAVSPLVKFLYDKDEIVRWSGAFAISTLAKRQVYEVASIKPLIDLLNDNNNKVIYNAAFALGNIAECGAFDRNAISPLIILLTHYHQRVRWSAAFALKTLAKKGIFNNDSLGCFMNLFFDPNIQVRYNAAYAIGWLAEYDIFDTSTIYPLISLMSDSNDIVRRSAIFAITCLAKKKVIDRAAIKPLLTLLSDDYDGVRKNAAIALKIIKEEMVNINGIDDNIGERIEPEIKRVAPAVVEPKLVSSPSVNTVEVKSAFGYKGATIIYKVKIENNTPDPISDIKVYPYVPNVFLLKEKEKSITLIEPSSSQTATFEIRPTGECGDCNVSGRVNYYNMASRKRLDIELEPSSLSIICPMLHRKEISEDAWRDLVARLAKAEETTTDIPIESEGLFGMISEILKDMNLFALVPSTNKTQQIFRGIARFYGEGVKGLRYAAQIEVVGGSKKSKLILKTWAEKEDALTGFYHGLLDEIEKRVKVKDYIDDSIVQYNIHYGDRIGNKFEGDVVAVHSTIGAGARKCPDCGKEVETNKNFCPECGAKL